MLRLGDGPMTMPVYELSDEVLFPPVDHAEDGLLAVGGDLRPERLDRKSVV